MRTTPASTFACALLIAGCASAPAPRPAPVASPAAASAGSPAPAPAAVPAHDALNAVLWAQRAIEHDLVLREIFRHAEETLPRALADSSWDALPHEEREGSVAGLAAAIIVDVDETVLDNSAFEARRLQADEPYNEAAWGEWCREEKARPLPGALEFAHRAAAAGVQIFYLTNRAKDLAAVTLDNLRRAGFPIAGDGAFLGLGSLLPGCEQIGTDKGCRRRLVGRTHRVLMEFGDQVGDFVDIVANTPEGRERAMAPYAGWIGERWFVLPNPIYGSWESAVAATAGPSLQAQRRAKVEALRTDRSP